GFERRLGSRAVPPAGELGDDVGPALVAAPAAGQGGVELRVAAVARRQRVDLAVLDGPAQGVKHAAHRASSAAIAAAVGGRATPRSQTNAVISSAGVTSNAGLRTATSGSVIRPPPGRRTSSASRSSISISSPLGSAGSTDDVGPATTKGIPAARAASAWAYVPTLLATSPLAATRSQPTITASISPRRMRPAAAPSTASVTGMPSRVNSQTVSRAPC